MEVMEAKGEAFGHVPTLIDFRFQQHHFAENGKNGQGKNKTGESGQNLFISLPLGTEILEDNQIVGEIVKSGDQVLLAAGGDGGFGNNHFKTSVNRAPRKFTSGKPCVERELTLRLKLIADVGMVGLPNAGKSTFLSIISSAKPKIGDYPFTTLNPMLGVAIHKQRRFIVSDIPGLVKDAHSGKGAGTRFLGHIERCKVLIHIIDSSTDDLKNNYQIVVEEMKKYDESLLKKPVITVLNKTDLLSNKLLSQKLKQLRKIEPKLFTLSTKTNVGLNEVLIETVKQIDLYEVKTNKVSQQKINWHPLDQ